MQNEEYQVKRIPENYENGIHIIGFKFKTSFFIEGVVLSVAVIAILFLFLNNIVHLKLTNMLPILIIFGGLAFYLGAKGINDELITTFIKNVIKFNKSRRVAYYNPRIKAEAKHITEQERLQENKDVLPFDKIKNLINKKDMVKTEEKGEQPTFDKDNMFFEDDKGIVDTPNSYRSKKEYKKYDTKRSKIASFSTENRED